MKSAFIHLNVHTNYSLLSGAGRVEELLGRAREMGSDALAITDTNGLYGAMLFLSKARELGIKPILGAQFECDSGVAVCLASDREGYSNLCRVITARHLDESFSLADALVRWQEGLFILTPDVALLRRLAGRIRDGRLFHEIQYYSDPTEEIFPDIPPIATNNVHFVSPDGREMHRLLTAIRKNKLLSEVMPNEMAPPDAWLKSADEMLRRFSGSRIGREAVANTRRIADACNLELETGKPIFPQFFSLKDIPPELAGETPRTALRKLALQGMHERYPLPSPEVFKRLDYELAVIDDLHFSEYFLIVWDIVNFALRKNIPIVGRGSAANSLVAYCLGITSADPLAHNLYFERFLNRSRRDCPDIDLDLCWRRRDEVLNYVYERHGADHVAMGSNHNTYQARSAFRDVARVFGLPIEEINRLSAMLPSYSAESIRDAKELFPESRDFPLDREPYRTLVARAEALDGFPRHLSIHSGGIVIGDRPLTHYLPLERSTKGLVVTQYEMNGVEAVGLVKIDLLGHRSLSVIADTVEAVKKNWSVGIELPGIPDGDRATAALLRAGRTIGCFQIESPGMRSLLQMIHAENRLDVIHALSLIRPGPSGSGMKERFVRRRLGEEPTVFLDPRLEKVLGDTYGVMLFQEDILKVAAVIAGFTLEEGDALRQAISKKRSPERMAALQQRFMHGAAACGVRRETAEEIWKLMQNFASYSYSAGIPAVWASHPQLRPLPCAWPRRAEPLRHWHHGAVAGCVELSRTSGMEGNGRSVTL
jgi:DNA-directed DNA polymerase III PolC